MINWERFESIQLIESSVNGHIADKMEGLSAVPPRGSKRNALAAVNSRSWRLGNGVGVVGSGQFRCVANGQTLPQESWYYGTVMYVSIGWIKGYLVVWAHPCGVSFESGQGRTKIHLRTIEEYRQ